MVGAPKVGIVHVPKTAGTALRRHLSGLTNLYTGPAYHEVASFPRSHVRGLSEQLRPTMISVEHARELFRFNDMIVAHASANFFRAAGADHVVAIVREPRARLVSLYREWQTVPPTAIQRLGARGRDITSVTAGSFADFLRRSRLSAQIEGAIAGYIDGFPIRRRPNHEALDRAFWSDELGDLLRHLASIGAIADAPPTEVGPVRVGAPRGERQSLDEVGLRRLARATRRDSAMLAALVEAGKLTQRPAGRLDEDFVETAGRLGLDVLVRGE